MSPYVTPYTNNIILRAPTQHVLGALNETSMRYAKISRAPTQRSCFWCTHRHHMLEVGALTCIHLKQDFGAVIDTPPQMLFLIDSQPIIPNTSMPELSVRPHMQHFFYWRYAQFILLTPCTCNICFIGATHS